MNPKHNLKASARRPASPTRLAARRAGGYLPIIGMEVHVELNTLSKMFCGCWAQHFNVKPNTHTCPVCLGLPGALPVPNKKAIDWTILIGLALNCQINHQSKFDRKHYFYPDLPKGYQISQYDEPLAIHGSLKIKNQTSKIKNIRITRVHLEEDTGKLVHSIINGKRVSLVDFNRSGVPLVEIVSEPDITSASEAKAYVKKIQRIIRYLGVSDCDMEKGSMRVEANISVSQRSQKLPNYKVEIKNLNSFKFLEKAINYEVHRQTNILESGQTPTQETRGWHESKKRTLSQRSKEEAQDYRYFPEPDIPPMKFSDSDIEAIKQTMPELPDEKLKRFINQFKLKTKDAAILTKNSETAAYFEEAVKVGKKHQIQPPKIANVIINKRIDISKHLPAKLIKLLAQKTQSQVVDEQVLKNWINQAIKQNPQAVKDFQQGKTQVIGFLIGQVQRLSKGKADAQKVRKILLQKLAK